jgi:hypothetical protein
MRKAKSSQKAKRKVECPAAFGYVLRCVNSLPYDFDLGEFVDNYISIEIAREGVETDPTVSSDRTNFIIILDKQFNSALKEKLSLDHYPELFAYIYDRQNDYGNIWPLILRKRAHTLCGIRFVLQWIAQRYAAATKAQAEKDSVSYGCPIDVIFNQHDLPLLSGFSPVKSSLGTGSNILTTGSALKGVDQYVKAEISIIVDKEGKLSVESASLLRDCIGVEARRVRMCPICRRIFWAGRIDQPACSKKCGTNYRQKKWRINYKEKYLQQRCSRPEKGR